MQEHPQQQQNTFTVINFNVFTPQTFYIIQQSNVPPQTQQQSHFFPMGFNGPSVHPHMNNTNTNVNNINNETQHNANTPTNQPPNHQHSNNNNNENNNQGNNVNHPIFILNNFLFPQFIHTAHNETLFNHIINQSFQEQQPKGPPPTSLKQLESLPTFTWNDNSIEKCLLIPKYECNNSCTVCQCEFEHDEPVVKLPCEHCFHKDCITPWIKEHNTCPNCKYELETEDTECNKQRTTNMIERYGENGFHMIQLSSEVDKIVVQLSRLLNECKQSENNNNNDNSSVEAQHEKRVRQLKTMDHTLLEKIIQLDNMNEFKREQQFNSRRELIQRIQAVQQKIEQHLREH